MIEFSIHGPTSFKHKGFNFSISPGGMLEFDEKFKKRFEEWRDNLLFKAMKQGLSFYLKTFVRDITENEIALEKAHFVSNDSVFCCQTSERCETYYLCFSSCGSELLKHVSFPCEEYEEEEFISFFEFESQLRIPYRIHAFLQNLD